MLLARLQGHQVNDIDHPDLQVRDTLPQEIDGGERLQRRDIAGAGYDHVDVGAGRFRSGLGPDADADVAMGRGLLDGQPLRRRLFAGAMTLIRS